MFLDGLITRNRAFLEAVCGLHQAGLIPANCYVLDLEAVEQNATLIAREAEKQGLKVLAMTKQIGRHPEAIRAIVRGGIDRFVAVDLDCALAIREAGCRVGHLGHLVQIPRGATEKGVGLSPDYWTVFSLDKAAEIAQACAKTGRRQKLLARIFAPGDTFYPGHEGGFPAEDILAIAGKLDALEGTEFAGITSFPALLYDPEKKRVLPTPNLTTLQKAATELRAAGRGDLEINAPGTTSSAVLPILAAAGATQVEPGHGLTGSTPLHAVEELPEKPALVYVSEISHIHQGKPYCFGGGLYVDPVFPAYQIRALVGGDAGALLRTRVKATFPPDNAIDYYGILEPEPNQRIKTGDTVIFGFRAQAFVTRAYVAGVAGISRGKPEVKEITDGFGRRVQWPS